MSEPQKGKLQNLSDTAFWVAQYRAEETARPDAVFKDSLASKLLEQRGKSIKDYMDSKNEISWPIVARTYLLDQVVMEQTAHDIDTVLCLAAGLDTRPYRLGLRKEVRWIEVDLPDILTYKAQVLKDDIPNCQLDRVTVDLTDRKERNRLFEEVNEKSSKVLVITEGLLVYLDPSEVSVLAQDLSGYAAFSRWSLDLASPGLVKMMNAKMGDKLADANAPFKFGPDEGPNYFEKFGWKKIQVHSFLKTAAALKRVNLWMRILAMLPESHGKQGSRPWAGICLYRNEN